MDLSGLTFTIDFLDLGESVDIQLPPADQVDDAQGPRRKMFGDVGADTGD